jgi:hypothetical protein
MPSRLIAAHAAAVMLSFAAISQAVARDWYVARGAPPPAGNRIYVCHGYSCRIVTPVTLSAAEFGRIAGPLKDARDAEAEREALAGVVQAFEKLVGNRVGTSGDLARTQIGQAEDGQMDCIDEATNTTSLLRVLAASGALKHHRVLQPSARGFFLDGRYPHATAVVAEIEGGAKWAIDSWPRANAEPPLIQPLPEWLRSRSALPS